jgi:hypothetical protein
LVERFRVRCFDAVDPRRCYLGLFGEGWWDLLIAGVA